MAGEQHATTTVFVGLGIVGLNLPNISAIFASISFVEGSAICLAFVCVEDTACFACPFVCVSLRVPEAGRDRLMLLFEPDFAVRWLRLYKQIQNRIYYHRVVAPL